MLRELAEGEGERVTFREILTELRHRAFGFTLLIFALPCCLPMPPGIPTVCGVAIVIIALNLIAARQRLWLPSAIADKSVARADLQRMVERVRRYLERLERICKPRLGRRHGARRQDIDRNRDFRARVHHDLADPVPRQHAAGLRGLASSRSA